jgi:hypothetical protein
MKNQRTTPAPDGWTLRKYGRFWAVYDHGSLVVVTVYRKGALEVMKRLAPQPSPMTRQEVPHGRAHS